MESLHNLPAIITEETLEAVQRAARDICAYSLAGPRPTPSEVTGELAVRHAGVGHGKVPHYYAMMDSGHGGLIMPMLAEKVMVITGAARGLGRAYALDAAREGAAVVVNDIDSEVRSVAAEIVAAGGSAVANEDSVTSWAGAERIVACATDSFGRIDGLVNNAGVINMVPPWEESEGSIREGMEVNVLGSIFVGTHAMKVMMGQRSGSIVNNSSHGAFGAPGRAVYVAAKGALASLTYAWAIDLAPYAIRVNAFAASSDSGMAKLSKTPLPPLSSPESNAPLVTYLLSDAADGITGQVIQRYRDGFMVVSPPDFTEHYAPVTDISTAGVIAAFDPILRSGLQRVGWYAAGGTKYQLSVSNPVD